jgi:hypothetical protein
MGIRNPSLFLSVELPQDFVLQPNTYPSTDKPGSVLVLALF